MLDPRYSCPRRDEENCNRIKYTTACRCHKLKAHADLGQSSKEGRLRDILRALLHGRGARDESVLCRRLVSTDLDDTVNRIQSAGLLTSSETQGQIVGATESLNGRKVWHEEK